MNGNVMVMVDSDIAMDEEVRSSFIDHGWQKMAKMRPMQYRYMLLCL
jgi:hypothetical protein